MAELDMASSAVPGPGTKTGNARSPNISGPPTARRCSAPRPRSIAGRLLADTGQPESGDLLGSPRMDRRATGTAGLCVLVLAATVVLREPNPGIGSWLRSQAASLSCRADRADPTLFTPQREVAEGKQSPGGYRLLKPSTAFEIPRSFGVVSRVFSSSDSISLQVSRDFEAGSIPAPPLRTSCSQHALPGCARRGS